MEQLVDILTTIVSYGSLLVILLAALFLVLSSTSNNEKACDTVFTSTIVTFAIVCVIYVGYQVVTYYLPVTNIITVG